MPDDDPIGIHPTPVGAQVGLPGIRDNLSNKYDFFRDDREGVDRWGRPYKDLWMVGSGWDEWACPLAESGACYGTRNPGARVAPDYAFSCQLDCGSCGGGGEGLSQTMNACCSDKGRPFLESAIAEIQHLRGIENLRLDQARVVEQASEPLPWHWPAIYFPTVEWGGRPWMEALERYSEGPCPCCKRDHGVYGRDWRMIATTMKTAGTSIKGRRVTPLRTRLGGTNAHLVVTGYTKDDVLDDFWDNRQNVYRFWQDSGVDTVVVPQFSAYPEWNCSLWVYNAHRQFVVYSECVELGFSRVVMDLAFGNHAKWWRDDWLTFVHENRLPCVAFSYQQFSSRGGLHPMAIREIRMLHDALPLTTSVMVFGVGTPAKIMAVSKLFAGRELSFSTVEAYARAAFFQMVPQGTPAPKGQHICAPGSACRAKRGGRAACKSAVF